MRTRHTMTLLLVMTLLTNLAHHGRGSVTASGEVEKGEVTWKRRILERLIRQRLASSDRQLGHFQNPSQQHLYPATPPEGSKNSGRQLRPLGSSILQSFYSNLIPSRRDWEQEEEPPVGSPTNGSSFAAGLSNLLPPPTYPKSLSVLMRQIELSEDPQDKSHQRRHVPELTSGESSSKDRKLQRQLERKKKREGKKKKRNKEKRRRENKRMQQILKNSDVSLHEYDGQEYLDCCPSKVVVVEKQVGKDRKNLAVEVRPSQQYFYERVCLPDIENKECVFPARSLRKGVVTRCAQQMSFVQAQVRPYSSEMDWHLDYIEVRSGCSCQVSVSPRKKRNKGQARPG